MARREKADIKAIIRWEVVDPGPVFRLVLCKYPARICREKEII